MEKRGQITIFIILAVVIVAITALVYSFYPQIKNTFGSEIKNPSAFIEDCLDDDLILATDLISSQGGSIDPEHFFLYKGEKIEYLCYTNEYYRTCTMQQPMLKEHIESEIKDNLNAKAIECFNELKDSYQGQGYGVTLTQGASRIELLPKRIVMEFNNTLSLTKGDSSESYKQFRINFENNIYELMSIAQSILNTETTWGDTDTSLYMTLYRDLKVEKYKQSEGSKIFIVTDLGNDNKFQFATRGIAWPPGGVI